MMRESEYAELSLMSFLPMKTILSSDLPPDQQESTLKALQDYYKKLVAENEQIASDARAQLDHVEALVNRTKVSSLAKLPSAPELTNKIAAIASNPTITATPKAKSTGNTKKKEAPSEKAASAKSSVKDRTKAASKSAAKTSARQENSTVKLLKPYQSTTLIGAIELVLKQHEGSILSADNVVQTLYGDLKPNLFKIAKDRITKSLSKGKIEGKWERVPDQQGCYTLSLASL